MVVDASAVGLWKKPHGERIRIVMLIVWMIQPETNGSAEETLKYSQSGDLGKTIVHSKVGQNHNLYVIFNYK